MAGGGPHHKKLTFKVQAENQICEVRVDTAGVLLYN